jgi:hypothetical protein
MQSPPPDNKLQPSGRSQSAVASVVDFFDSIRKIAAGIAAVIAAGVAVAGVLHLTGNETSKPRGRTAVAAVRPIDKSQTGVSATSTLPRQDSTSGANDYAADNTLDNDTRTAWVEGSPGRGTGQSLTYVFPEREALDRIRLVNGYAKSKDAQLDNGALKTVEIRTDSKRIRHTFSRGSRPQAVHEDFGSTRRVVVTILSAYPGAKFSDTALSEISFYRRSR